MKKIVTKMAWFVLIMLVSAEMQAATFVGNGGAMGDVELVGTLKQINETYRGVVQDVSVDETELFCTCANAFKNHSLCSILEKLNKKERLYCAKIMAKKASFMVAISGNFKNKIEAHWTNKQINIKENGEIRAVEAVANPLAKTLTLNQNRFVDMENRDRVFLISHELFHYSKIDKKYIEDEGEHGPFKGKIGGRRLLDALGAATVMESQRNRVFSKYKKRLNMPKGWKKNWVDINYSGNSTGGVKSVWALDSHDTFNLSYRHYFGAFGIIGRYSSGGDKKTVLSSIEAEERITNYGVGATFRFFPFSNPLNYFGQSHLELNGLITSGTSDYEIDDGFVKTKASTKFTGWAVGGNYYIPLFQMWTYLGYGIEKQDYKYSNINLEYDKLRTSVRIGISYGF